MLRPSPAGSARILLSRANPESFLPSAPSAALGGAEPSLLLPLEAGLPPRWPCRAHPGTPQQAGNAGGSCSWSPLRSQLFSCRSRPSSLVRSKSLVNGTQRVLGGDVPSQRSPEQISAIGCIQKSSTVPHSHPPVLPGVGRKPGGIQNFRCAPGTPQRG